jgi:ribonuclease VapC
VIVAGTSAIVAIAFAEPERDAFLRTIRQADKTLLSTVSAVEASVVVHGRRGQRAVVLLDDFPRLPAFEMVPPGSSELAAAYAAFVAFGRFSGHPAALNFRRCVQLCTRKSARPAASIQRERFQPNRHSRRSGPTMTAAASDRRRLPACRWRLSPK